MQYAEFISILNSNNISVFTVKDVANIIGKSCHYATKFIHGRNNVEKIEKGKYYLKGTSNDVVVSHIIYPSYLSLISSFRFYNLTTQLPMEKYVITTMSHKPLKFNKYKINFITVDKRLLFGFDNINGVMVASPEKAFIDTLYLKKRIWYTEEFDTGIKRGLINIEKLKKYALMFNDSNLINRLGYFLEKTYSMDCTDMLNYRSKRYVKIANNGKFRDKKWRVIYND